MDKKELIEIKDKTKEMIDKIDNENYICFIHRYIQGICNVKKKA